MTTQTTTERRIYLNTLLLKPMLIYISAPYSLGDVVSNVRFACEVGDKILAKGHIPFIPHLSHF
ncbi:MAG: hypothetical protein Q8M94_09640, partial [Ignavibacteria bacterium]|nr:hypothetical protein [Ignavibacteria bacterium]